MCVSQYPIGTSNVSATGKAKYYHIHNRSWRCKFVFLTPPNNPSPGPVSLSAQWSALTPPPHRAAPCHGSSGVVHPVQTPSAMSSASSASAAAEQHRKLQLNAENL